MLDVGGVVLGGAWGIRLSGALAYHVRYLERNMTHMWKFSHGSYIPIIHLSQRLSIWEELEHNVRFWKTDGLQQHMYRRTEARLLAPWKCSACRTVNNQPINFAKAFLHKSD